MKWKPYPKYKDSGIEWLDQVPEGWVVGRVKRLSSKIGSGKTPTGGSQVYSDEGVLFLRSQNVYDDGLRLDDVVYISDQLDQELRASRVQAGDILLNITGASLGRTCAAPRGIGRANVNQHVCLIRLRDLRGVAFISYAFKSNMFQSQIEGEQNGAARDGLNFEQLGNLLITRPPESDGEKVAAFLDLETAKIDILIAKQERLIDLLQEKRQSAVSHAVTKGLDTNAPMKPSGIKWLGDVPTHWNIQRLRHLSGGLGVGLVINPSTYVAAEGVPFLFGGNIQPGYIDAAGARRITPENSRKLAPSMLRTGDLVTVRVGYPGITACVPPELDGCNCASVLIVRHSPRFVSEWLCYAMNSWVGMVQVGAVQYGAAQEQFNLGHAVDFAFPVPPPVEQRRIVAALDLVCAELDELKLKTEQSIALLREHRAALISAAVTGKIDVREFNHA